MGFEPGQILLPRHDATYWARATAGFDFSRADNEPVDKFNRVLWAGMIGNKPYPKLLGASSARARQRDDD